MVVNIQTGIKMITQNQYEADFLNYQCLLVNKEVGKATIKETLMIIFNQDEYDHFYAYRVDKILEWATNAEKQQVFEETDEYLDQVQTFKLLTKEVRKSDMSPESEKLSFWNNIMRFIDRTLLS